MKTKNCNLILVVSSFIFITNVIATFYKKYYIYSILFFFLTIASIMFHYNGNIYIRILDSLFIAAIILYGSFVLYNKSTTYNQKHVLLIIITFLSVVFLYFYGYYVKKYCYHPDKYIASKYHFLIHILSSFGHHLITFL
jgi:hypothetical protein